MERSEQLLSKLLEELRELGVADTELRTALHGYLPASGTEGDGLVHYAREGEHALTAVYSSRGGLRALRATEWLTEARFEDLRRHLREALLNTVPRVARFVLFGLVPCTGAWRYRDQFQILPVPEEAPKPQQILENQPLVLEVCYAGVEEPVEHLMLEVERLGEAVKRAGLLLAGLIPRIEYRSPRTPRPAWGVEMDTGTEYRSKWVQLGYVSPSS